DEDLAFLRVVHARDQVDERALPAPRGADYTERSTGGHGETNVAQNPPRLAILIARVVKPDVPELDAASGPARRKMLARLGDRDPRGYVEDFPQPSHRSFTALKEIHHPAKRDHRPGEHRQVHAERDERSDGYRAVDRQHSTGAQHDHRAQSAKECE